MIEAIAEIFLVMTMAIMTLYLIYTEIFAFEMMQSIFKKNEGHSTEMVKPDRLMLVWAD